MNKTGICKLLEDRQLKTTAKLKILADELVDSEFNLKQYQDKIIFIKSHIDKLSKY